MPPFKKLDSISVIIPAHNSARFIEQAIDSVLQQTFRPIEILVIDDNSSDQTSQIVEKYKSPVRLLKLEKRGVSAARNMGILEAQGKFIAFLDSDDFFIKPDKLEKQLKIVLEKNCDLVMSGWRVIEENTDKISDRFVWLEVPFLNLFNLVRTFAVLPSTLFVRRQQLLKINSFDENLNHAEDIDLVLRLLLGGCRAEWLPEISVAYRQHSQNATRHIHAQHQGMRKVLEKLFLRQDLPFPIRQIEGAINYKSYLNSAYICFINDDLSAMRTYLLESRKYSEFSGEGLLLDWFYCFEKFSTAFGKVGLDAGKLLNSIEWGELESLIVA